MLQRTNGEHILYTCFSSVDSVSSKYSNEEHLDQQSGTCVDQEGNSDGNDDKCFHHRACNSPVIYSPTTNPVETTPKCADVLKPEGKIGDDEGSLIDANKGRNSHETNNSSDYSSTMTGCASAVSEITTDSGKKLTNLIDDDNDCRTGYDRLMYMTTASEPSQDLNDLCGCPQRVGLSNVDLLVLFDRPAIASEQVHGESLISMLKNIHQSICFLPTHRVNWGSVEIEELPVSDNTHDNVTDNQMHQNSGLTDRSEVCLSPAEGDSGKIVDSILNVQTSAQSTSLDSKLAAAEDAEFHAEDVQHSVCRKAKSSSAPTIVETSLAGGCGCGRFEPDRSRLRSAVMALRGRSPNNLLNIHGSGHVFDTSGDKPSSKNIQRRSTNVTRSRVQISYKNYESVASSRGAQNSLALTTSNAKNGDASGCVRSHQTKPHCYSVTSEHISNLPPVNCRQRVPTAKSHVEAADSRLKCSVTQPAVVNQQRQNRLSTSRFYSQSKIDVIVHPSSSSVGVSAPSAFDHIRAPVVGGRVSHSRRRRRCQQYQPRVGQLQLPPVDLGPRAPPRLLPPIIPSEQRTQRRSHPLAVRRPYTPPDRDVVSSRALGPSLAFDSHRCLRRPVLRRLPPLADRINSNTTALWN